MLVIGCPEFGLHLIECITDVGELLADDIIRVRGLDINGNTPLIAVEMIGLSGTGYLQQVSTGNVGIINIPRLHVGDIHTIGVNRNLVAKLVIAFVLSVHNDVNVLNPRSIAESKPSAHLEGDVVAHQALITPVGNQRPLLSFSRTFQRRPLEHVVGLPVVELHTVGTLLEEFVTGAVATLTNQNRIFLQAGSIVVDDTHLGLQFMDFVIGLFSAIGMVGESGKVRQLVEMAVITHALMTVKLHLCDIGLAVGWGTPTNIAETARNKYTGVREHASIPSIGNHKEGNRIHEVLAVGTLEKP